MAKGKSFGRALAPALLLPLGLAPLSVHALGLGNLRVTSALGQPLSATIELVGATPAEAELAAVRLASAEAHQRMGVDSMLRDVTLRFTVQVGSDGQSYVRVTSPEPVREPYIDFVVEAISPTGQVARHYTILLDPVGTAPSPPPALPAVAGSLPPSTPDRMQAPSRPRSNPFASVAAPKAGAVFGPVPPGATLWAIARRIQPAGIGLDPVMSAIVRSNPDAFIKGDPGLLRAGSRLSIPDTQTLRGESAGETQPAAQEVPTPAAAAAAPPEPAVKQDAVSGPVDAAPAAPAAPDAEVRVLRSEDAAPATTLGSAERAVDGATGNRVQLLEEALDAAQQQNESLQQRMGSLEEQIRTLTELVKNSPAQSDAGSGPVTPVAPAIAELATAQTSPPSVQAPVAPPAASTPVQAANVQESETASYLPVAVGAAAVGLGGLLLWARRRKTAQAPVFPVAPIVADAGVPDAAMAAPVDVPVTSSVEPYPPSGANVEWVEPAAVQPAAVDVPAEAIELVDDGFGDPVDTQIDLLAAYVGMADGASARQIHDEILRVGNPAQKAQAAALLARLDA